MPEAVIVTALRTPVGKAPRGSLSGTRPDDLAGLVVRAALDRLKAGVEASEGDGTNLRIDDVILGCAMPEAEQGLNLGRIAVARAGLPAGVPGITVNRFCASGLQAIAYAASQIATGQSEAVIAGGVESMSRVPMGGYKPSPNPELARNYPQVYMSMGHTAEEVARRFEVSRADQDEFACQSHRKAAAAVAEGRFRDEILPVTVKNLGFDGRKAVSSQFTFDADEGVRPGTSVEALSKLKPAFHVTGSVTAGNSSQTSDGAAAVVVMSAARARELGLKPLAVFRAYAVAGVDPDVMGIGPVEAIPKALKQAGITLDQVDLIELNEAFAAQALAVIRKLKIDPDRVNPNGGAIALGHPLGCTGAKLTATLLHEAARRAKAAAEGGVASGVRAPRYGLVSMCVGGGMGAAGVFEFIN